MTRALVRPEFLVAVRVRRAEQALLLPPDERAVVADHLRALLAPTVISVRVYLNVLMEILADGRFKTVYEDGVISRNPDRSMAEESEVWELDPSHPEVFPIFGYAASLSDMSEPATRAHLHSAYGSARLILSDAMRERTTVFFGDSLSWVRKIEGAPAPIDSPDEFAWPHDRGSPLERRSADEGSMDEYVELQFLGGISCPMIREVVFDFAPDHRVVQALRCHHIPWHVNLMPAIPEYLRDTVGPLPADTLATP
jgi:hypothetical protein